VNPMGSCLPMLIQMPICVRALHHAAVSVELTTRPSSGWSDD